MSRWQGRWLVWAWLLLPGMAGAQEPLLIPRAGDNDAATSGTPLKLTRTTHGPKSPPGTLRAGTSQSAGGWVTTAGSLLFVLGLIAGGAYLIARHGGRLPGMLPAEVVQVLGKRFIDSRNSVQLVRCGSKILILANSSQHGLRTLSEITDPSEVELLTGQCVPNPLGNSSSRVQRSRSLGDAGPLTSAPNSPHIAGLARTTSGPSGPGGTRG